MSVVKELIRTRRTTEQLALGIMNWLRNQKYLILSMTVICTRLKHIMKLQNWSVTECLFMNLYQVRLC